MKSKPLTIQFDPVPRPKEFTVVQQIRVPSTLKADFQEAARAAGMDVSKLVRQFMEQFVAQHKARQSETSSD